MDFETMYIALYANNAVRDAQICKGDPEKEDIWEDDYWEDIEDAEVFVGVFSGPSAEAVLADVVAREGCHENAIRLIPLAAYHSKALLKDNVDCAATGAPCHMCKSGRCDSRIEREA